MSSIPQLNPISHEVILQISRDMSQAWGEGHRDCSLIIRWRGLKCKHFFEVGRLKLMTGMCSLAALQADESRFRSHFLDHSSKRCMGKVTINRKLRSIGYCGLAQTSFDSNVVCLICRVTRFPCYVHVPTCARTKSHTNSQLLKFNNFIEKLDIGLLFKLL